MKPSDEVLARMADEHAIREVIYRYARAADRRQFDVMRSCYHPDARDDHGFYKGNVEGFLARAEQGLARYERTMHFTGNLYIEVDGDAAKSEAYTVAYHRIPATKDAPPQDYVVGLRYVDRFEKRKGEWRISERVCVFDWKRTDPVPPDSEFGPGFLRGRPDTEDFALSRKRPVT